MTVDTLLESVPTENIKRRAAVAARQKIAEWTRHLAALL